MTKYYRLIPCSKSQVYSAVSASGNTAGQVLIENDGVESFTARLYGSAWRSEDLIRSIGSDFVVSERLHDVLKQLLLPIGLRSFCVKVVRKSAEEVGSYRLLYNPGRRFDVLDRSASDLITAAGVLVDVRSFVADFQKIPEFDLFPIVPYGWIATGRAKQLFDDIKATGVRFEEITVKREGKT